ncbi:MAG: hypothetical protein JJU36_03645 [Phycisphaeraceae bacterium]|nr:hypothetical protein [Phycisphaeraceae bacterium]
MAIFPQFTLVEQTDDGPFEGGLDLLAGVFEAWVGRLCACRVLHQDAVTHGSQQVTLQGLADVSAQRPETEVIAQKFE